MKKRKKSLAGHYLIFALALFIGLLINVSANIIYEMFLKDKPTVQIVILGLTFLAFVAIIYLYHNKLREPLAKFLGEFE